MPARLVVMLSGSGRTLENLLHHTGQLGTPTVPGGETGTPTVPGGDLPETSAPPLSATITGVIASRPCRGAEIARNAGIPLEIIPGDIPAERLADLLARWQADWVVLAGYLRRVNIPGGSPSTGSPSLRGGRATSAAKPPRAEPRKNYTGRVVNIHPALLPRFGGPGMYGNRVHAAVLEAGESESGCTVHLADGEYDEGPIILQKTCPVHPEDTPETLAARVFELEKQAYPQALHLLLTRAAQEQNQ